MNRSIKYIIPIFLCSCYSPKETIRRTETIIICPNVRYVIVGKWKYEVVLTKGGQPYLRRWTEKNLSK